jgi:hypothetical protein
MRTMTDSVLFKAGLTGLVLGAATLPQLDAGIFSSRGNDTSCATPPATCAQPVVIVQETPKKKKAKDAPRGPVVSSVGAMIERGPAVDIDPDDAREALREAAGKDDKDKSEAAGEAETTRLDTLERDVKELKVLMARLSAVVENLADRQPAPKE